MGVGFQACITGHMTGGVYIQRGGGSASSGVCIQGGLHPGESVSRMDGQTPEHYRIRSTSGGTHPTGMHSCCECVWKQK